MPDLILNKDNSILLPAFNTSDILESDISEIILYLFLSDIISPDIVNSVQLTINLYNPVTKEIKDGLSTFLKLEAGQYLGFRLPKELFKKNSNSNERFLVKMVDQNANLVFAGPDNKSRKMPYLETTYSHPGHKILVEKIAPNFNFINIPNGQIHYTGRDFIMKNEKENFWNKILWYLLVPVLVVILSFIIIKKFF